MEVSGNNLFSLPSSSTVMFLRNAMDIFAVIISSAICYMAFIRDRPRMFYLMVFILIGSLFIILRRVYLNRSVTFSDTGITLRRRSQMNMITKYYHWKQIHSIHYVNTDAGVSKNLGRIETHLKNTDVIDLDLGDYCSYDFLNYKGRYDSDIVSNLMDICNRNGKKLHLR